MQSPERFEQIALPHLDSVYRAAVAVCRRSDEAEDLTQMTFAQGAGAVRYVAARDQLQGLALSNHAESLDRPAPAQESGRQCRSDR